MKVLDKENIRVNSDDCFRWSRKMVERMQELHNKTDMTPEQYEEYRMAVLVATLLDDVGNDLLEAAKMALAQEETTNELN